MSGFDLLCVIDTMLSLYSVPLTLMGVLSPRHSSTQVVIFQHNVFERKAKYFDSECSLHIANWNWLAEGRTDRGKDGWADRWRVDGQTGRQTYIRIEAVPLKIMTLTKQPKRPWGDQEGPPICCCWNPNIYVNWELMQNFGTLQQTLLGFLTESSERDK